MIVELDEIQFSMVGFNETVVLFQDQGIIIKFFGKNSDRKQEPNTSRSVKG